MSRNCIDHVFVKFRTFVVEANAQRKFEDVKSLKANLAEIRGEINKLVAASNVRSR